VDLSILWAEPLAVAQGVAALLGHGGLEVALKTVVSATRTALLASSILGGTGLKAPRNMPDGHASRGRD
jgi:uncharacterized membrane protein YhfC